MQLRLQDLQQQLASDGSNGVALAKQVREELPTESKVAAELEAREVAWQLSRADQLDREGLISACGLLLQLERRAEAEQLRAAWLRRQEQRFDVRTLAGQIRTADRASWPMPWLRTPSLPACDWRVIPW